MQKDFTDRKTVARLPIYCTYPKLFPNTTYFLSFYFVSDTGGNCYTGKTRRRTLIGAETAPEVHSDIERKRRGENLHIDFSALRTKGSVGELKGEKNVLNYRARKQWAI